MVAAISTNSNLRIPKTPSSTPHHRPPLSPSEKTNNNNNNADDNSISRNPRSKAITPSRHSPSSSSSSLPKRSQSTNRPRPAAQSPRPMSITTTRSLSVSFQGESFSFQTTKPKPISQTPPAKPRNSLSAKTRQPNSLTKSLDCSIEKKGSALAAAVRVLGHSVVFDGKDVYLASDSDSSGSQEWNGSAMGRGTARGIVVPAKFWPENLSPARRKLVDAQLLSPPRMTSPSPVMGKVPSILSFAAEARRVKKGEGRIEEAHSLRLLHNRYLQWRCVNAQADAALSAQRANVEKNLHNVWLTTSELRDSVAKKRIKLQLMLQNLKLTSILKGQMIYVEEWSLMDKEHSNYLSGLITALKASTLRLPVVSGARVDILELQNAIGSTVDVMQAMGTSICSLLSKLEGTSTAVSELAKAAAHERALLDQTKDLLSIVAALHVKQCSLQGHILQRYHNKNLQVHL